MSTEGYVYILFCAETEMIKIGCTKNQSRARQKAIMGAHPSKLVNVLNAKVPDRFAAEYQCHEQFKLQRRSGEWFLSPLVDVITYICEELDCLELDFECLGVLLRAVAGAKGKSANRFKRSINNHCQ